MERFSACGLQLQANLPFLGASMTRALLLFCAPAMFAACDVGDVPAALTPDGPGVVCEQPGVNADGNHNDGTGCLNGGCHSPTSGGDGTDPTKPTNMIMGGTLYETANGAGKGTATIIIEWGGMSKKTITATANGVGNFYMAPDELTGITYPATVKVSLCPDAERPMITPLKDATDLNCSKAGCHGNGTPKVFWRQ
jgi:hypothetical protein